MGNDYKYACTITAPQPRLLEDVSSKYIIRMRANDATYYMSVGASIAACLTRDGEVFTWIMDHMAS